MKLMGFKQKLMISMVIMVVCSLIVTNWLAFSRFQEDKVEAIRSTLMASINYEADGLEAWMRTKVQAVKTAAERGQNLTEPAEIVNVTELVAQAAELKYVTFGFEDGKAYSNDGWPDGIAPSDYDPRTRPWYIQARQQTGMSVSDLYNDSLSGEPLVSISYPVANGVISGDIKATILDQAVKSINYPGAVALILDQTGKVIASSSERVKAGIRMSDKPELEGVEREILNQSQGIIDYELGGQQKLAFYRQISLVGEQKWHLTIGLNKSVAYAAVGEFLQETLIVSGSLVLLVTLMIVWLLQLLYKPVLELKAMTHSLADGNGDLTRRLDIRSGDDLQEIANGINTFIANLQRMMQEVSSATGNISSGINGLRQQADSTRNILNQHAQQTEQVVLAVNEMSTTADTVSSSAAQAATVTTQANQDAQRSGEVVEGAVADVNALLVEVESMSEHIQTVDADTQRINSVLSVIGEIAEQTNLLALNAAIEAARAGEQGRGFAVVADEVRALAGRTQQSTGEIADVLDKLRNGSQRIVQSMEDTRQRGETAKVTTGQVMDTLNGVQGSVAQINDLNTRIATSAEEQSAVTEQINGTVAAINGMVGELSGNTETTVESARNLTDVNQQLREIVGRFRLE